MLSYNVISPTIILIICIVTTGIIFIIYVTKTRINNINISINKCFNIAGAIFSCIDFSVFRKTCGITYYSRHCVIGMPIRCTAVRQSNLEIIL